MFDVHNILHLVKSGWVVRNLIEMISVQTFFLTDFSVEKEVAAFVVEEEDVIPFVGFEMTGVADFLGVGFSLTFESREKR